MKWHGISAFAYWPIKKRLFLEKWDRIDRFAVDPDFIMKMGSGTFAGIAGEANNLSLFYRFPGMDE